MTVVKIEFKERSDMELETFEIIEIDEKDSNDERLKMHQLAAWKTKPFQKLIIGKVIGSDEKGATIIININRHTYLGSYPYKAIPGEYVLMELQRQYSDIVEGGVLGGIQTGVMDEITEQAEELEKHASGSSWKYGLVQIREQNEITADIIKAAAKQVKDDYDNRLKNEQQKAQAAMAKQAQVVDKWETEGTHGCWNKNIVTPMDYRYGKTTIQIEIEKNWKDIGAQKNKRWFRRWSEPFRLLRNSDYEGKVTVRFGSKEIPAYVGVRSSEVDYVKVPKARVYAILAKYAEGHITKSDIKIYKSLSNIKMDVAKMDYITIHRSQGNVNVSIDIKFETQTRTKVKLFGKETELEWNKTKELFTRGRSTITIFEVEDYFKLAEKFGLDRKAALQVLKSHYMAAQI